MPPEVSFRLNGTIVPMLIVNRERVQGKLTGRWQIAVWIDGRGRFVIDNEMNLWDITFPQHVLEYRNETEWEQLNAERQASTDQGWVRVTPRDLVTVLEQAGVINGASQWLQTTSSAQLN